MTKLFVINKSEIRKIALREFVCNVESKFIRPGDRIRKTRVFI